MFGFIWVFQGTLKRQLYLYNILCSSWHRMKHFHYNYIFYRISCVQIARSLCSFPFSGEVDVFGVFFSLLQDRIRTTLLENLN